MPLTKEPEQDSPKEPEQDSTKGAAITTREVGRTVLRSNVLLAIAKVPTIPGSTQMAKAAIVIGNALENDPEQEGVTPIIARGVGTTTHLLTVGVFSKVIIVSTAAVVAAPTTPVFASVALAATTSMLIDKIVEVSAPVNELVTQLTENVLKAAPGAVSSALQKQRELDEILASAQLGLRSIPSVKQAKPVEQSSSKSSSSRDRAQRDFFREQREKLNTLGTLEMCAPSTTSPAREYFSIQPRSFFASSNERQNYVPGEFSFCLTDKPRETSSGSGADDTKGKDFHVESSPNERTCSLDGGCTW